MLSKVANLSEMDLLLQTVMFTLYGNQYESREEYLLLTVFQVAFLIIFKIVLVDQFELATDFGSLLRANTPATRMLTTYTRRGPGQAYLKTILNDFIVEVCKNKSLDLEINPQKVPL